MIRYYLNYQFRALTRHDVHSPFVFDLIETVFRDHTKYPVYGELEDLRKSLKKNRTPIKITDLGAGSRKPSAVKTVAEILKTAVQKKGYQRLIYRLIKKYQPKIVLELGTSLGLTSRYMLAALPKNGKLYTLEGDPAILKFATQQVISGDSRVNAIEGNFDDELPELLNSGVKIDMAYIDGNHTYDATLRYFEMILPYLAENGFIVFDDIYWSKDMMKAWEKIVKHPASQTSIDLFKLGIVFTEKAKVKQHFMLKF